MIAANDGFLRYGNLDISHLHIVSNPGCTQVLTSGGEDITSMVQEMDIHIGRDCISTVTIKFVNVRVDVEVVEKDTRV